MSGSRDLGRRISPDFLPICLTVVLLIGPLLVLPAILLAPLIGACSTEVKRQIRDLSGFDFEIDETECDLLAKDAGSSILISSAGEDKKTVLFKFGPVDDDLLPRINVDKLHSTVLISISHISFIYLQTDRWRNMTIRYDIGHVDYPSAGKVQDQALPNAK
jgi:hypothetical protein